VCTENTCIFFLKNPEHLDNDQDSGGGDFILLIPPLIYFRIKTFNNQSQDSSI